MTSELTGLAPAKINLTLHVTGQRPDGYHLLDSLVAFADIGDHLTLQTGPQMSMEITGPFAAGVPSDHRNLAWQAAESCGWTGHIRLEKNLPHGGGIGGGSADAAAVLRMLGGAEHALALGADVPVCLAGRAQRMRGIGDVLDVIEDMPKLHAVLVNPMAAVPTPAVFANLSQKNNPPMPDPLPGPQGLRQWMLWLAGMRNDLEAAAIAEAPVIEDALRALSACSGAYLARMSGSGSTSFALFDNPGLAEVMAKELAKAHPDWWVREVVLS